MMHRRQFLGALAASATPLAAAGSKPNIVLIFADDLGRADLGCYGGKEIPTPNIDSIARNGTLFSDGYVSCPYCSPTRAGLMTGRYQTHFGHEFNPGPAGEAQENFGLPLTETAMPKRLKDLGYRTGIFGKWHLGYREPYRPLQRGFDEFYGFLGGAHSYLDARADAANPIYEGNQPVESVEYTTEEFARRACAFIEKNKDQSFFAYVPFNAVHAPMHTLPRHESKFAHIADPLRRTYAGMLSALDDGVGAILKTLEKNRLTRDTVVIFASDNGGPTPVNTSRNAPLRGLKAQIYEGGIRVPFLMQWPSRLPKNKVYSQPVIALDLLPTMIAAAGGKTDASWKLDGVNLLPHVEGKDKKAPHERLLWRFGQQWAIREGDWKLMSMGGPPELYNLRADIGESQDLSAKEKDRMARMAATWEEWNKKNMAPLWHAPGAQGQKGKKKKKKKKGD